MKGSSEKSLGLTSSLFALQEKGRPRPRSFVSSPCPVCAAGGVDTQSNLPAVCLSPLGDSYTDIGFVPARPQKSIPVLHEILMCIAKDHRF